MRTPCRRVPEHLLVDSGLAAYDAVFWDFLVYSWRTGLQSLGKGDIEMRFNPVSINNDIFKGVGDALSML